MAGGKLPWRSHTMAGQFTADGPVRGEGVGPSTDRAGGARIGLREVANHQRQDRRQRDQQKHCRCNDQIPNAIDEQDLQDRTALRRAHYLATFMCGSPAIARAFKVARNWSLRRAPSVLAVT